METEDLTPSPLSALVKAVDAFALLQHEGCELRHAYLHGFDAWSASTENEIHRLSNACELVDNAGQLGATMRNFPLQSDVSLLPLSLFPAFYSCIPMSLSSARSVTLGGAGAVVLRSVYPVVLEWLADVSCALGAPSTQCVCDRNKELAGAIAKRASLTSRTPIAKDMLARSGLWNILEKMREASLRRWKTSMSELASLAETVLYSIAQWTERPDSIADATRIDMLQLGTSIKDMLAAVRTVTAPALSELMHEETIARLRRLESIVGRVQVCQNRLVVDSAIHTWLQTEGAACHQSLECVCDMVSRAVVVEAQCVDTLLDTLVVIRTGVRTVHSTDAAIPFPPHRDPSALGGAQLLVECSGPVQGIMYEDVAQMRIIALLHQLEREHAFAPGLVRADIAVTAGIEVETVASLVFGHIRIRRHELSSVECLVKSTMAVRSERCPMINASVGRAVAHLAWHSLSTICAFCSSGGIDRVAQQSAVAAYLGATNGETDRLKGMLDLLLERVSTRRQSLDIHDGCVHPLRQLLMEIESIRGWFDQRRSGVPPSRVTLKLSDVRKVPHLEDVLRQQQLYTHIRFQSGKHRACTVTLSSALLVRVF
jgi:hypothetical protein